MLPALSRGHRKPKVTIAVPTYAAPDLASDTFESGAQLTLSSTPFSYPWDGSDGGPSRLTVINDPTGGGHGKVVQIAYPSSGLTRAFMYTFTGSPAYGFGSTIYARTYFYIPSGNLTSLRKLIYYFANVSTSNFFVVVGTENGNLYCEVSSNGTPTRISISPTVPVSYDAWHYLEAKVVINSGAAVADGSVDVWLDGATTPAASGSGIILLNTSARMDYIEIGDQLQGASTDENRWLDNAAVSTQRIGP